MKMFGAENFCPDMPEEATPDDEREFDELARELAEQLHEYARYIREDALPLYLMNGKTN
jgi:hypothetical protein